MEVRKQKSGEERIKEQSTSETVCFAWGNRFCSFQRHKNKPSLFCFFFGRCKKEREHKCYRDINKSHDFKLLLDTIFYQKSPAFQGTQAGSK
jgi:hypothetical protein